LLAPLNFNRRQQSCKSGRALRAGFVGLNYEKVSGRIQAQNAELTNNRSSFFSFKYSNFVFFNANTDRGESRSAYLRWLVYNKYV